MDRRSSPPRDAQGTFRRTTQQGSRARILRKACLNRHDAPAVVTETGTLRTRVASSMLGPCHIGTPSPKWSWGPGAYVEPGLRMGYGLVCQVPGSLGLGLAGAVAVRIRDGRRVMMGALGEVQVHDLSLLTGTGVSASASRARTHRLCTPPPPRTSPGTEPEGAFGKTARPLIAAFATFAEFGSGLKNPHPRGHGAVRAKGKLRSRKPKLSDRQVRQLRRLHDTDDCNVNGLGEVFPVSRPAVCRTLQRATVPARPDL